MRHWIDGPLGWIHGRWMTGEETNVVFFRGTCLDSLTRGLLGQHRRPRAYGKGDDWGVLMHDMHAWDCGATGDYAGAHYTALCPPGAELAVFITEPCLAKAHGPWFEYYRDGRLHTALTFESLGDGTGHAPDHFLPALTEARLTGPLTEADERDHEERTVAAITRFLGLPELEVAMPSTAP
ncbi:hypothetical protein [Streptomyces sp. SID4985]|uniref:hypothetical protein n=1 Tax=unclassified Streptomyces TaxID=2593676 RepID=UPI00136A6C84|nr:hypothetical protein [Streptomyces sp. SID4985]MYQ48258.1 hypothetical protein [Streptomyces sp. SID4985]